MILGERSNGKSYSVKEYALDKWSMLMGKFMYIRRKKEQKTRKAMVKLFSDMGDYCLDKFGDYIHYNNDAGFYIERGNEREVIGYCTSIEEGANIKSIPFNDITTIIFDEFLEYGQPIEDEISKFINIISTIVRKRDNVEIFLIANTVTKFSPYFELFGIDPKKLKMGEIYYLKHENGVTAAIEYCSSKNIVNGVKGKNSYVGFDNNATANMILYGEWEYDVVNTSNIDGIGWNCKKRLIPLYITALGETYELAIYNAKNPIAFVRKPNTQGGMVKRHIRYNLSYDNSLRLTTQDGVVPTYARINSLMDNDIVKLMEVFKLCMESKRIVFDTMATGSDFNRFIKQIL